MKISLFIVIGAALLVLGCASPDRRELPPSAGKGVSIFDYSRSLDHNNDELISNDEWVAAGGNEGKIRPSSPSGEEEAMSGKRQPDRFLSNLMVRMADISHDEPMTPQEFRSPPGARIASLEF